MMLELLNIILKKLALVFRAKILFGCGLFHTINYLRYIQSLLYIIYSLTSYKQRFLVKKRNLCNENKTVTFHRSSYVKDIFKHRIP